MKRYRFSYITPALLATFCLFILALAMHEQRSPGYHPHSPAETAAKSIFDMAGQPVNVPDIIKRIGYPYPANTLDFLALGMGPKMAVVPKDVRHMDGWGLQLMARMGYTNLKRKPGGFSGNTIDPEPVLLADPQIVFTDTTNPIGKQRLRRWGITAVAVKFQVDSIDDCANSIDWLASNFGDESARYMAADFRRYINATLAEVNRRLASLKTHEKPRVLLINDNGNGTYTVLRNSIFIDNVRRAGGQPIAEIAISGLVGPEQILAWEPDAILLQTSRPSGLEAFTTNRVLGTLRSVRNGEIYPIVASHGGRMETILAILYIAKLLHPERFTDLDISKEIVSFHARFFHIVMSPEEAEKYFYPARVQEKAKLSIGVNVSAAQKFRV